MPPGPSLARSYHVQGPRGAHTLLLASELDVAQRRRVWVPASAVCGAFITWLPWGGTSSARRSLFFAQRKILTRSRVIAQVDLWNKAWWLRLKSWKCDHRADVYFTYTCRFGVIISCLFWVFLYNLLLFKSFLVCEYFSPTAGWIGWFSHIIVLPGLVLGP